MTNDKLKDAFERNAAIDELLKHLAAEKNHLRPLVAEYRAKVGAGQHYTQSDLVERVIKFMSSRTSTSRRDLARGPLQRVGKNVRDNIVERMIADFVIREEVTGKSTNLNLLALDDDEVKRYKFMRAGKSIW